MILQQFKDPRVQTSARVARFHDSCKARAILITFDKLFFTIDVQRGSVSFQVPASGQKTSGIALTHERTSFPFRSRTQRSEDFWENDGYIERADLDGSDRKVSMPIGNFVTGKQITFNGKSRRLYWYDREGLRVMSRRTDGSDLTAHVQTGKTPHEYRTT